jgi:dihydroceramidase
VSLLGLLKLFHTMASEWIWSVNNLAHTHSTGWWGEVEANHAFCEPHYAVSHYIAEFFNSTSSLIYILLAFFIQLPKHDAFLQISRIWLLAIGIGSLLFHGTMRYAMQLADEIPMVGFVTTLMIAKISMPHPWLIGYTGLATVISIFYGISLIGVYVLWDQYEIFIHGFTILVVCDFLLSIPLWQNKRGSKWETLQIRSHMVGIFTILLGKVAWEVEHLLCESHPFVWPLHVVWHLLSCTSAYGSVTSTYVMRAKETEEIPRLFGFTEFRIRDTKID